MKALLATFTSLALAFLVAVPAANAATPADALQGVAALRSLTEVLPVTKPSEATKVRTDLIKYLDKANNYLIQAGATADHKKANDLYYKAATEVWNYRVKLGKLDSQGKVGRPEAIMLLAMAAATQDCIVEVYYPDFD